MRRAPTRYLACTVLAAESWQRLLGSSIRYFFEKKNTRKCPASTTGEYVPRLPQREWPRRGGSGDRQQLRSACLTMPTDCSWQQEIQDFDIRVRGLGPDVGESNHLYTAAGLAVQRVAAPGQPTTLRAEDRNTGES